MNLAEYLENLPRGGKKLIALRLGVTASYLSRLVSGDRTVTAERAIQIEDATDGMVTRFDLRPDIQWTAVKRSKRRVNHTAWETNLAANPQSRSAPRVAVGSSSIEVAR